MSDGCANETAVLKFDIRSWWHTGTGLGLTAHLDASVMRDHHGLALLPGKAVKGLVREALHLAGELGRIPSDAAIWFCGTGLADPPQDDKAVRSQRFATCEGNASFDNAELPPAWKELAATEAGRVQLAGLFQGVHATAIDADGQAKDGTLRANEVAAPMVLEAMVTVSGSPLWENQPEWQGWDWRKVLETALPLIRGLGGHRARGLGRVRVTLEGAQVATQVVPASAGGGTILRFRLDLLGDTVLSLDSGTAGQHKSLDFVPGAALLGAAAAAGRYAGFQEGAAWDVFHSGKVSFGNAYPLLPGNLLSMPVPLSWHKPKYPGALGLPDEPLTIWDKVSDAIADIDQGKAQEAQWEQLKEGFVVPDAGNGAVGIRSEKRFRRSTALDRNRLGKTRAGMLYGYESLAGGQTFWFDLIIDGGIGNDVRQRIVEALTGGEIRLGKSRHAEYGRARVTLLDASAEPAAPGGPVSPDGPVRIYLSSDLALTDLKTGAPVAVPAPEHFGLPAAWRLDPKHSFVSMRRYSPFNGHRRSFDTERQVLVAGSVLTFEGNAVDKADPVALARMMAEGVGLHRQDGLGRIVVDPAFLGKRDAWRIDRHKLADRHGAAVPAGTLGRWLIRRHAELTLPPLAHGLARTYEGHFLNIYREVLREARLLGRSPAEMAPARSQWGAVRETAARSRSLDELKRTLFDKDHGLCSSGVAAARWEAGSKLDVRAMGGEGPAAFKETRFRDLLQDLTEPDRLADWLAGAGLSAGPGEHDPKAFDPMVFELSRMILTALGQRMPRALAERQRKTLEAAQ
jgi:CRISPR-associated protein Csx10